ncbi:MAG TPA: M20/M25/M40 family metallo-hydrolase, partial [Polyangia bacterium]|nr:M20/M25/M40 family metallo-hydrolase [Polyangia bacterium]
MARGPARLSLLLVAMFHLPWLLGCHSSAGGRTETPGPIVPAGAEGPNGAGGAAAAVDVPAPATPGPPGAGGDGAAADASSPSTEDGAANEPADLAFVPPSDAAAMLVAALDPRRFRDNIKTVAGFGDRLQGTTKFDAASAWLDQSLAGLGYAVEHHHYTYLGAPRTNTFATKVGTTSPDRMYIVSAHLDGRGNGGAADDDGSGVSLVLEVARAFAPAAVTTEISVRFAFWCNEETGMDGSSAYVTDRSPMQGIESPPGSGRFPEPRWLGMIQHDMMLYDHGLPPGPVQRPGADINIDYQVG